MSEQNEIESLNGFHTNGSHDVQNKETHQINKNDASGTLKSKNVRIHDRRTSVRLEPEMWRALREIAEAEDCSIHDLCGAVYDLKHERMSFTAALRVFVMEYFRAVAKESAQLSDVQRIVNNVRQTARG